MVWTKRGSLALALVLVALVVACRPSEPPLESSFVRTGADQILESPYQDLLKGKRIGLITNQSGINQRLESTARRLQDWPARESILFFAPEHGLDGVVQAGGSVESSGSVISLYGADRAPSQEVLSQLDVLVYDIQDVGARFYTFISTLSAVMKAAARAGLPVVVLDRPAPIRGDRVEGPVLEPGYESFVGTFRLPVRYGMTVGELAQLLNQEAEIGCDLQVVPMKNYRRDLWFDETGLPWVAPSPNMPTLETATVYPGFCLIEGTNLSEGRGTTRPFEWIGAPWLQAAQLAERLNQRELPGVRFRPQSFTPTFSKYVGEVCRGVQVHVVDRDRFEPIRTVLFLLSEVARSHPGEFQFNPGFDRLSGNGWLRTAIMEGDPPDSIVQRWEKPLAEFLTLRSQFLIY